MSTIIGELYNALKEAGASDEKARAAAQALADCGSRFAKIEADLLVLPALGGVLVVQGGEDHAAARGRPRARC